MEVVSERYVNWREPDATEEEDIVEKLIERKPKHRIATSFDSEGGESGVSEEVVETEDRKLEITTSFDIDEEIKNDLKQEELAEEVLSVKNDNIDKASGMGFSNGTSGVQTRSTYVSVSEDGSTIQSSEVTEESMTTTIQGSHTIITTQHKKIQDFETGPFYHSSQSVQADESQHSSLKSAVNGNGHVLFSSQNSHENHLQNDRYEELGDILDGEPDPIDYDVEGVLKKQETHDLICPNCNKCITRRVILRKRKRANKDGLRYHKRDKIEEADSETQLDTVNENSANTVHNATNNHSQTDVITCWSCFSLLIPSGRGFKLFKLFGSTKQPEVISTSNPNQTPLLTPDKGGMPVDQSNTFNSSQLGSGNTVDQNPTITKKGIMSNLFEVNSTIKQNSGVENSKQTTPSLLFSKGLSSVGNGCLETTNTELGAKGQKPEAGSNVHYVSSTISYSHDEYQVTVNDKPDSEFESFKDRESLKSEDILSAVPGSTLLDSRMTDLEKGSNNTTIIIEDDVRISIQNGNEQNVSRDTVIPRPETQVRERRPVVLVGEARDWGILKSIVYGGLIESITSLGVVSSAAGAETATLNVLALGLANLIGGLILIFHNLKDLKKSAVEGPSQEVDRYYETLGRRNHITLHAVVAVLSFIIFGLIPIVTYAFTFRTSDNRDYKSLAVIGASLICITLLSIGKAHTKSSPRSIRSYFNSIIYYLYIAIAASGLSYIAGKLLQELIEKTGWFDTTSSLNSIFPDSILSSQPAWGSY